MFGLGRKKQDPAPDAATQAAPADESARKRSALARWWEDMDPARRQAITRGYYAVIIAMIVGVAAVYGMGAMEKRIQNGLSGPVPTSMKIVLVGAPPSMPRSLVQQLTTALVPKDAKAGDPHLARKVYKAALANPWIKNVADTCLKTDPADPTQVIVEVRAQYRQAFAKVQWAGFDGTPEFVDIDGVRLPQDQAPRYFAEAKDSAGKTLQLFYVREGHVPPEAKYYSVHYITIEGAAKEPPPYGKPWEGDDVAAGLRLVKLMMTRTYGNEITTVDVRNFDGKAHPSDSRLNLRAKIGKGPETLIRFGRFEDPAADWELPTSVKMYYLDTFVAANGKLTGVASSIDLRMNCLMYTPLAEQ